MRGLTLATMVGAAALALAGPEARAQSSVYTVAKVAVDVSAADAVAAKDLGLAEAQERALRTVLKRVAPFGANDRLPRVKADLVSDMLNGFSVRHEAISGRRYIATLDFEFRPAAVQQLMRAHGVPVADGQAPAIGVLPIHVRDGQVQTGARDTWRAAWTRLDLANALTPVRLLQTGALDRQAVDEMLAGGAGLRALAAQHGVDRLVLAVAQEATAERRFVTRLYGVDATGVIDLERADRVSAGKPAADPAAAVALGVLETRWKLVQSPEGPEAESGERLRVAVAVEFSGARQWHDIRSRLGQLPGLQGLRVDSLSARSAAVTFEFEGGAQRLNQQLAARRLALENRGGTWVLRSQ